QRYDGTGQLAGDEFLINTQTDGDQRYSSVAAFGDGSFVVTWTSSGAGIYGQRFNANGEPDGDAFRISGEQAVVSSGQNTATSSVAVLADGGFVVAWMSFGQDGDGAGIYARRYGEDGQPEGGEFLVHPGAIAGNQTQPSVSALADGFIITWTSGDANQHGVYGQLYGAGGAAVGDAFLINTETAGAQTGSTVTALSDGGFLVTWTSQGQDGSGAGVYGQRFDEDGQRGGSGVRVNETTSGNQSTLPGIGANLVAELEDRSVVSVWQAAVGSSPPNNEIYGRIFNVPGEVVQAVEDEPAILPLTVALADTDGSEVLSRIEIYDLPADFTLALGGRDGGPWVIDRDDGQAEAEFLDGLRA